MADPSEVRGQKRPERRPQPAPVRVLHWANVPLLLIMGASGLQILIAYPHLGPQGEQWQWLPTLNAPQQLRIGGWLAGSRHWHFAFMWLVVANAVLYLIWLFATGEWRRRMFLPRRDSADAVRTMRSYVRLKNPPVRGELYNGLQRLSYTGVFVLAVIEVLTGLVLYKPVQLHALGVIFGGYEPARAIHFFGMIALGLFTLGHVTMVLLHPRSLLEMITGGKKP